MKQLFARFFWIVACALGVACGAGPARAGGALPNPPGVPAAEDLQRDAQLAATFDGGVLIAFVSSHCPYCERVLNDFLIPISKNVDYQAKVVIRRVEVGSDLRLRDFAGNMTRLGKFASESGVHMVPTVVMFDRQGRRLGKPLVGLSTVDYYAQYLDETIDHGLAAIRGPAGP